LQSPDRDRASDAENRNVPGIGRAGNVSRAKEPAALFDDMGDLAAVSHQASSRSELFRAFAAGLAGALSADLTQVLETVPEEGGFVLRAGWGFSEGLYGRARVPGGLLSQAGRALLDPLGCPVELADFSLPHEWADDELLAEHGARSGISARVRTGALDFGVIGAFYRAPRMFSPEDGRFLLRAATLLGEGIERLGHEAEAIAWRSRAELLRAGAALLKVPAPRDDLLSAAAEAAVNGSGGAAPPIADWCFADALDDGGRHPSLSRVEVARASGNAGGLEDAFWAPLTPNAPHGAPRAYATRAPELVESIEEDFSFAVVGSPHLRRAVEEIRPCSYMCVPVVGAGRFHGALGFLRTRTGTPAAYDRSDLSTCAEFAGLVGAAIDRAMPRPDIAEAQDAVRSLATPADPGLTEREHEVLAGIAAGDRLTQIGRKLSIETNTVRTHKRHLCQKLGLSPGSSDARIVAEARRRGVPDLPT
jgi:GAF domain-containing protein